MACHEIEFSSMMKPLDCPSRAVLESYADGNLDPSLLMATESHIRQCERCRGILGAASREVTSSWAPQRSVAENTSSEILESSVDDPQSDPEASDTESLTPWLHQAFRSHTDYELQSRIGAGGMGEVWQAQHRRLGKTVAIKLMRSGRSDQSQRTRRFEREMRTIGRLDHPNVIRATDAGEIDGLLYLVMEYIDGIDVGELVKIHGRLSVADTAEIIRQAALGLDHIHAQGILHRDVKPSNIMISSLGVVKILDVGLARWQEHESSDDSISATGHILGTPDYMAPEQWVEPESVSPASDLYSLGCAMYCLLAGRAPFADRSHSSFGKKMEAHRTSPAPDIANVQNLGRIQPLLEQLLEKQADRRPESAVGVAEQLSEIAGRAKLQALFSATKDRVKIESEPARLPHQPTVLSKPVVEPAARIPSGADRIEDPRPARPSQDGANLTTDSSLVESSDQDVALAANAEPQPFIRRRSAWVIVALVAISAFMLLRPENKQSPDQTTIYAVANEPLADNGYGLVHLLKGHTGPIDFLVATSQNQLISDSEDGTLRQWDLSTGKQIRVLEGADVVGGFVVTESGDRLYAADSTGKLVCWDLGTGDVVQEIQIHDSRIGVLDLSRDGNQILASCRDGSVKLWDITAETLLWELPEHSERVGEVRFNPGFKKPEYALTADNDRLNYWDIRTKRLVRSYPGRRRAVFTPDGRKILSGTTAPGIAFLRKLDSESVEFEFADFDHVVRSFAMSSTGEYACAGLHEPSLRIWNLQTGKEWMRIESETHCTNQVALVPQSATLVFGGGIDPVSKVVTGDFDIRVWQLPESLTDRD